MALLKVEDLSIATFEKRMAKLLVEEVSFSVDSGEIVGLTGESGSGKTITALATVGLLPPQLRAVTGTIGFENRIVSSGDIKALKKHRGKNIFFIPQSPLGALNPSIKIGSQIQEILSGSKKERDALVRSLLKMVHLDPALINLYPFQLSGGMRQRVLMSMAVAVNPKVLIVDEPTTGLDDENKEAVIMLLKWFKREYKGGVLLISHDFRVIETLADKMLVMYQGHLVEQGPVRSLLKNPRHFHTKMLLESLNRLKGILCERETAGD